MTGGQLPSVAFRGRLRVIGTGVRTSLGPDLAGSAAAARGGICAFGNHPFMIDRAGMPMVVARDPALPMDLEVDERQARLAAGAALECVAALPCDPGGPPCSVMLCLALPQVDGKACPAEPIVRAVQVAIAGRASIAHVQVSNGVHVAGLAAILAAHQAARSGFHGHVLVLGVNSWLDAETLEWLDENELLRVNTRPFGFVPGEAAAALLIGPAEAPPGAPAQICLDAGAISVDAIPDPAQPRLGLALTDAARLALQGSERLADVLYADLNGVPERADEVGYCIVRVRTHLQAGHRMITPAESFGDVGAATVPLMIALAAAAAAKSDGSGSTMLMLAQSLGGERGALLAYAPPRGAAR